MQGQQTTLMHAARAGHSEAVEALVRGGARLELQDSHGDTALLMAVSRGKAATTRCLVALGAGVNHANKVRALAQLGTWACGAAASRACARA